VARLSLIGVGLMGASFALAARRARTFDHIVGHDVDRAALGAAHTAGIVDATAPSLEAAVLGADAVLVAVPPSAIAACVADVCGALGDATVPVFDLGSVKAAVIAALRARRGTLPSNFVPCHPMAGSERQGSTAADAALYRGRRVFLTPCPETDHAATAKVERFWAACGAHTCVVDAEAHDRAVAATSHLPHLLAFAYMARFGNEADRVLFDYAGPGFRDFTRIAGGDPALWRDILLSNRQAVAAELDGLVRRLTDLGAALGTSDAATLESIFVAARDARGAYVRGDSVKGAAADRHDGA
jgi:prephenate dehydrogenase